MKPPMTSPIAGSPKGIDRPGIESMPDGDRQRVSSLGILRGHPIWAHMVDNSPTPFVNEPAFVFYLEEKNY